MSHRTPKVVAYHAAIGVRDDAGRALTIMADLPDWADDTTVLEEAAAECGALTVGELVKAIRRGLARGYRVVQGAPEFGEGLLPFNKRLT